MEGKSKRKFTPEFKLKLVLEVFKEKDTLATISKRHELHPNQVSDWNRTAEAEAISDGRCVRV
jgi:transposase